MTWPRPLTVTDVTGHLPPGWAGDLLLLSTEHGTDHTLDGSDPTSRSVDDRAGTALVRITDADTLDAHAAWLGQAYRGPLLRLAEDVYGGPLRTVDDPSRYTVNDSRRGTGYEWHVDSNPCTAVLFVTTSTEGGDLVLRHDGQEVVVPPRSGYCVLAALDDVEHCVTTVGDAQRVSVPMCFVRPDDVRDASITDYLYPR